MIFIKIPDKDFEMMDAPVTQSEWQEVMGNNPSYFKDNPNNPVERVSWNDCKEFIEKLNYKNDGFIYRLPNEQEWEYCAKSCDKQNVDEIAWYWENSNKSTRPGKQKKPNDLGLYDMLGNVWEWCEDKYSEEESSVRVIRGGSWRGNAQGLRSGYRNHDSPGGRDGDLGFRLVRTPVTEGK